MDRFVLVTDHSLNLKKIAMTSPRGLIIRSSHYTVKETIDRLQAILLQKGVTIYTRIDQQEELAKTGQHIPPLEFLLFGNPKAGGPIMAVHPAAAIDLPLKVVAWEDDAKQVRIAYNEAQYIQERFALPADLSGPLDLNLVVNKTLGE